MAAQKYFFTVSRTLSSISLPGLIFAVHLSCTGLGQKFTGVIKPAVLQELHKVNRGL